MLPTSPLLQNAIRLTLFTRPNCGLCDSAKSVLYKLAERKKFDLKQVDVTHPAHSHWRSIYEFDTPVLHFQSWSEAHDQPGLNTNVQKLMHRFTESQVEQIIDDIAKCD